MYNDYNVVRVPPNYGRISFSRQELKHILISVLALTLIFALAFNDLVMTELSNGYLEALPYAIGISAVAVLLGFLIHEMGHKVVAQRFGAWAEFRMYPFGLVLGFIFALLGAVIAAPGAVYIQGQITKRQNGLISIAGPLTNIAIGSIFLIAWLLVGSDGFVGFTLRFLALISLLLGVFNLIPMPPLDGYKVARWNIPVYILTVGVAVVLLLVAYGFI